MLIRRAEQTSCCLTFFGVVNVKQKILVVRNSSFSSSFVQELTTRIVWKILKSLNFWFLASKSPYCLIYGRYGQFSTFSDNLGPNFPGLFNFSGLFHIRGQASNLCKTRTKHFQTIKLSPGLGVVTSNVRTKFHGNRNSLSVVLALHTRKFGLFSAFWRYGASSVSRLLSK